VIRDYLKQTNGAPFFTWRQQGPGGFASASIAIPQNPAIPPQRRPPETLLVCGHGATLEEAKAVARGEAAERYSLVFQGTEPALRATFNDVSENAIAPQELLQFSDEQYDDCDDWNHGRWAFPYIPPYCPPDYPILWSPVLSLTQDLVRLAPTQYCYFASAPAEDPLFVASDSNGCAAGPDLAFAVLHGTLELIERDAIARWWIERKRKPAYPFPRTKEAQDLRAEFDHDGRETALLNLTGELGVPIVAATAWDRATGGRLSLGFGASLDPDHAALRALRELHQGSDQHSVDPAVPRISSMARAHALWVANATVESDPHLLPQSGPALRSDCPYAGLPELVSAMAARKMDLCMLDLTRPETGLTVVRMLCPELRPPHYRLGGKDSYSRDGANPAPFAL